MSTESENNFIIVVIVLLLIHYMTSSSSTTTTTEGFRRMRRYQEQGAGGFTVNPNATVSDKMVPYPCTAGQTYQACNDAIASKLTTAENKYMAKTTDKALKEEYQKALMAKQDFMFCQANPNETCPEGKSKSFFQTGGGIAVIVIISLVGAMLVFGVGRMSKSCQTVGESIAKSISPGFKVNFEKFLKKF
jgi:hypothetical protein